MFCFFGPRGMWDLNSPARDQTHTSCFGRWSLNHWISRGSPWNSTLTGLPTFLFTKSVKPTLGDHFSTLAAYFHFLVGLAHAFPFLLRFLGSVLFLSPADGSWNSQAGQVGFQVTYSKVYTYWMDERVDVRWEGNQTRASHKIVKRTLVDTETMTAVGLSEWNRCGKIFGWVAICCWGAGSERVRPPPFYNVSFSFGVLATGKSGVSCVHLYPGICKGPEEKVLGLQPLFWTFKILGLVW